MKTDSRQIYLLISTTFSFYIRLQHYLCDEKFILIKDLQKVNPGDIVLPCCVKAHTLLYQREVYKIFDNKTLFYEMLKNYFTLNQIRLIPTYDSKYQGDNKYSTFIIKPNEDYGSKNQRIETGYVYDLVKKYAQNNQIQDILEIRAIYEIDFFCKNGEKRGSIFHKTNAKTRKQSDYFFGVYSTELTTLPEGMLHLCDSIMKESNYTGFIQFEFIEDIHGTIYFMECNPRMSGSMNNPHYFKKRIEPNYPITSRFCDSLIDSNEYTIGSKIHMFNIPYNYYQYILYQLHVSFNEDPSNTSLSNKSDVDKYFNQSEHTDLGPCGYTVQTTTSYDSFEFLNRDYKSW